MHAVDEPWRRAGDGESASITTRKKARTSAILRLPSHMLEGIKNAANKRDVPYQSLIKVWLQEKLEEA